MEKISLKMTLRDCLTKFPELEKLLHTLIEECVYCEGFRDETLENVFKALRLDPEKSLEKLLEALKEE